MSHSTLKLNLLTVFHRYDDPVGSTLHMLGHLYALRANSLWKNEPHSDWLASTVASVESKLGSSSPARDAAYKHFAQGPTEAMARHASVADLRAISAYCKPGTYPPVTHAFDPLAPSTSLTNYDEMYFQDVPRGQPAAGPAARQPHVPGAFGDEEGDEDIDLEGMDPQVLLNHVLEQAEAAGQAVSPFRLVAPS